MTLHGIQGGQDLALEPHCAIPQSLTDEEIMYTYTSGDSQYPQTVVCPLAPRASALMSEPRVQRPKRAQHELDCGAALQEADEAHQHHLSQQREALLGFIIGPICFERTVENI